MQLHVPDQDEPVPLSSPHGAAAIVRGFIPSNLVFLSGLLPSIDDRGPSQKPPKANTFNWPGTGLRMPFVRDRAYDPGVFSKLIEPPRMVGRTQAKAEGGTARTTRRAKITFAFITRSEFQPKGRKSMSARKHTTLKKKIGTDPARSRSSLRGAVSYSANGLKTFSIARLRRTLPRYNHRPRLRDESACHITSLPELARLRAGNLQTYSTL